MKYVSTRGGMQPSPFSEILVEGLAPDGGLVVPETVPQVSAAELEAWRGLDYAGLAIEVIGRYADGVPRDDLERLCRAAYDPALFDRDEIVPIRRLDDELALVGLSEGPTLAFKDMAMQFLGQALEYALAHDGATLNILGATSGDTGSAAEVALRGKRGIAVFMLSPQGRMSRFQRAQMYSLTDENIHNIAVAGDFDDCQHLVKQIAGDAEFKRRYRIGAVNSINFARVCAQVVYYVWAWLRVTDALPEAERAAQRIDVTVPSGNFGNIFSGYLARCMGVPIRRLVLATNENNVLDEFFRTGVYRPRAGVEALATSSPSMDISRASNFERFVFEVLGRDPERLREAWVGLERDGVLDLSAERERFAGEFGFVSGSSTHADRVAAIRETHERYGVVVDPHTADGLAVARRNLERGIPMLVLETAKPAKFPDIVEEAIGRTPEVPEHLRELLDAPQVVTETANDAAAIRAIIERDALA
ncbi:threonine synthase [Agromyces sp. H3Y2-19a]|uniref:threonine synthase n=1 Tax=Agromyces TaxID=33877 RepID=UPI001E63B933|nr:MULTISPECIES: threonine synthase [Agromyces]MCD5346706.1 threonine synthase [Agromyces sp. S2-1-8]MDF0513066.1 threonine synthase [Agromyces chromiiresistens]